MKVEGEEARIARERLDAGGEEVIVHGLDDDDDEDDEESEDTPDGETE